MNFVILCAIIRVILIYLERITMKLGEKIRSLRIAKLMTQSELAGTEITRNMLSRIENGAAQPSLDTLRYIAAKLNVSPGFLLAESGEEKTYLKQSEINGIKAAYLSGDYRIGRDMCLNSMSGDDDEIGLVLAECTLGVAVEEFSRGNLRSAAEYFDKSVEACATTAYNTDRILATAAMYFRYIQQISPTLASNIIDEAETAVYASYHDPFCAYAANFIAVKQTGNREFVPKIGDDNVFSLHIKAIDNMSNGDYASAYTKLHQILVGDEPIPEPMLYFVFCDLEICCRETDDFKGAYEYSIDKRALLQKMLF